MTILYNSKGYFCEGEIGKDWQFNMHFGRILVTEKEITLIKQSNISLTDIGTSVDNYHKDYVIPLNKIKKVYNVKQRKIYTVIVETRDGYVFSITLADEKSYGKKMSIKLSNIINTVIITGRNKE